MSGKNGPMRLRPDVRAAVSPQNRLHRESGEQVEEPFSPELYRRWHLLQADRGGTSLNGIGSEVIRTLFFQKKKSDLFVTVGFVYSR